MVNKYLAYILALVVLGLVFAAFSYVGYEQGKGECTIYDLHPKSLPASYRTFYYINNSWQIASNYTIYEITPDRIEREDKFLILPADDGDS